MSAKATKFRVEWDDGTVWIAEGDVAAKVMEWYQSGEAMNCIHGAHYSGPQVTIAKLAAQQPDSLLGRAMVVLKGLDMAVEWELAPAIKQEIAEICKEFEARGAAKEVGDGGD